MSAKVYRPRMRTVVALAIETALPYSTVRRDRDWSNVPPDRKHMCLCAADTVVEELCRAGYAIVRLTTGATADKGE